MALVSISFSSDDARARAAHDRLLDDQEKIIQKYRSMAGMSSKSASELRRETSVRKANALAQKESLGVAKRAAQITRQLRTPQEKFNAAMREAISLKDKGALSADALLRRYKQLKRELAEEKRAMDASNRGLQEAKRLAASSVRPMERYRQKLGQITRLHRDGKLSANELKNAQVGLREELNKDLNFDSSENAITRLIGKVGEYAQAFGPVATAIGLVEVAMQKVNAEQQRGMDATESVFDANRRLVQVSANKEELDHHIKFSDKLAGSFGIDRSAARRITFTADSNDMSFREAVMISSANKVIEAEAAIEAGAQLPRLFPQEKISASGAVSALLAASEKSRADAESLARVLPTAAASASQAGWTYASTLAGVSQMTNRTSTPDVASTRFGAFAAKAALENRGTDLVGTIEHLRDNDEYRENFLKENREVNEAYSLLLDGLDELKQLRRQLKSEQNSASALKKKSALASTQSGMVRLEQMRASVQRTEIAEESKLGVWGLRGKTAAQEYEVAVLNQDSVSSAAVRYGLGVPQISGRAATVAGGFLGLEPRDAGQFGASVARATALGPVFGPYAYMQDAWETWERYEQITSKQAMGESQRKKAAQIEIRSQDKSEAIRRGDTMSGTDPQQLNTAGAKQVVTQVVGQEDRLPFANAPRRTGFASGQHADPLLVAIEKTNSKLGEIQDELRQGRANGEQALENAASSLSESSSNLDRSSGSLQRQSMSRAASAAASQVGRDE